MKIKLVILIIVLFCAKLLLAQPPKDNPLATYYSGTVGYPAWTDKIKWQNVIDMSLYNQGLNDFQKFEKARDQLYTAGGGILYYPAGTYDFSDAPADGPNGRGLMLKTGVVIRGATPTGDKDAKDGTLGLLTKFLFKFNTRSGGQVPRDWNIFGIVPSGSEELKDVNYVGIAWIQAVGAVVYFGPQVNWGATWATAGSWQSDLAKTTWKNRVPDGTHPMDPFNGGGTIYKGAGNGRLIFGCVFQDAAVMNDAMDFGSGPSGFYMYKFGARVGIYGSDVFIANNVLPKSTKNFKYTQLTCNTDQNSGCTKKCLSTRNSSVLFDYGKPNGIDVNKELLGLTGFGSGGFFKERIIVEDNYVYTHGHKGFNISGKWVIIRNNDN
ncbi:MAG: hypothetical protein H0W84_10635, partial [Bacteroidetes bacterium]|nr:hypothetical protein [Bacteroidota bacterium]